VIRGKSSGKTSDSVYSYPKRPHGTARFTTSSVKLSDFDEKTEMQKRYCFGGDKSSGKTSDIAICHAVTASKTARNLSPLQKHKRFYRNHFQKQHWEWRGRSESSWKPSDLELSQLRKALRIVHWQQIVL